MLAMVDTVYGLAIIRAGFAPRASIGWWPASAATVLFLPTIIWGWVSTINGLFLTCGVFTRHDAVFYGTGVALEFLWGLASLDYFLLRGGRELWGVSAVHLGLAALVLINAGWGEPGETHRA